MGFKWIKTNNIEVVYSTYEKITVDGVSYPKGFLVDPENMSEIYNAKREASSMENSSPKHTITHNDDFKVRVVSLAPASWNETIGKSNMPLLLVSKDDIDPFVISIDADLMCAFILESSINNGTIDVPVLFAYNCGRLGILHKNMSAYKRMIDDANLKRNIRRGQTSKWEIGYSYRTLTESSTMLGTFSNIISVGYHGVDYSSYINPSCTDREIIVDFNRPDAVVYSDLRENEVSKDNISKTIISRLNSMFNTQSPDRTKCPARQKGDQMFVPSENYFDDIVNSLVDYKSHNVLHMIKHAFAVYKYNPNATIKILESARNIYNEDISDFNFGIIPSWVDRNRRLVYLRYPEHYPKDKVIKEVLYNGNSHPIHVVYNNTDEVFNDWSTLISYLIDIVKENKENI